MDERRIERALRQGPPDEPAYHPRVEPQFRVTGEPAPTPPRPAAADEDAPVLERPLRIDVHPRRTQPRVTSLLVPLAAAVVVLIGAAAWFAALRVQPDVAASPPPDALARLLAGGSMRVAVTDGPPQTISSGSAYIGFDIDVARAVADELGLRADVAAVSSSELDSQGSARWDIAMAQLAPGDGAPVVPYYAWPSWLAVPIDSSATSVEGLTSARVCAVVGSAGQAWLAGQRADAVETVEAPPGVTLLEAATEEECVAAVNEGRADALITAALLDDELETRGLRTLTASPALVETRSIVIVDGGAHDTTSLVAAVERAIADLRLRGRLGEISRATFGGRDLTEGVP